MGLDPPLLCSPMETGCVRALLWFFHGWVCSGETLEAVSRIVSLSPLSNSEMGQTQPVLELSSLRLSDWSPQGCTVG